MATMRGTRVAMKNGVWHVRVRAESGRLIAPEVADRRNLARTVVRLADSERLILFHCPDTHLHLVLACERGRAGEVARRIEISLSHRGLRFDPARIREVEGSWHLARLARYVPGNSEHHGAVVDPLHEASSVLDLLGLRVVAHRTLARLQAALPRWRPAQLLPLLGVEELRAGSDLRLLRESAASAPSMWGVASARPPPRWPGCWIFACGTCSGASGACRTGRWSGRSSFSWDSGSA